MGLRRPIGTAIALCERIPLSLIALLARFSVGLVFLKSGLTKIDGFRVSDAALFLFHEENRVPLLDPWLAAHLAAFAELTMPLFLFAGLGARFAALVLLAMTIVIQVFVYPEAYVTHGLWAVALLVIISRGAGTLSVDYIIRGNTSLPLVGRDHRVGVPPSTE
jgi:putative oxidoreductase